jgi:hypothetical protein
MLKHVPLICSVGEGVGVGGSVTVGLGVGVGGTVTLGLGVGVGVSAVGLGVGVGVSAVGLGVGVNVSVNDGVGVGSLVAVGNGVDVGFAVNGYSTKYVGQSDCTNGLVLTKKTLVALSGTLTKTPF